MTPTRLAELGHGQGEGQAGPPPQHPRPAPTVSTGALPEVPQFPYELRPKSEDSHAHLPDDQFEDNPEQHDEGRDDSDEAGSPVECASFHDVATLRERLVNDGTVHIPVFVQLPDANDLSCVGPPMTLSATAQHRPQYLFRRSARLASKAGHKVSSWSLQLLSEDGISVISSTAQLQSILAECPADDCVFILGTLCAM